MLNDMLWVWGDEKIRRGFGGEEIWIGLDEKLEGMGVVEVFGLL